MPRAPTASANVKPAKYRSLTSSAVLIRRIWLEVIGFQPVSGRPFPIPSVAWGMVQSWCDEVCYRRSDIMPPRRAMVPARHYTHRFGLADQPGEVRDDRHAHPRGTSESPGRQAVDRSVRWPRGEVGRGAGRPDAAVRNGGAIGDG